VSTVFNALLVAVLALLASCAKPPPQVQPQVHYVLEPAWQADDGTWFYPEQSYSYDRTGIAGVLPSAHTILTTDGEVYDPASMAAASQTLQLPAVARVTNLQTGRQVLVRVNERGPANPGRVIALTPRAAELLGIPEGGAAPVRVQVEEAPSRALVESLHGGADRIALQAAPRAAVQAETLAPPGAAQSAPGGQVTIGGAGDNALASAGPVPPLKLPEQVFQVPAQPGQLWIRADEFARRDYAERQRAQLTGLSPQIENLSTGRAQRYLVKAGPFASIAAADAALDQARREGVTDARIVVE
jgi:rare lipoprotein A